MGNAELKLGMAERKKKQENEAKFVKSLFSNGSYETKRESTSWETKIKEKKVRQPRS